MNASHFRSIAGCFGFIGVACGAFGAHALKARVSLEDLEIWKTAVLYLMIHTLVILITSHSKYYKTCYFFIIGNIIFSGSLFALVLTNMRWLGAVTPIGGVFYLMGWMRVAYLSIREKEFGER